MSSTPLLHFSFTFDGTVWKTVTDSATERLYIEVRNTEKKAVSFFCLDLPKATWVLEDYRFDEPWWISLQAVSGNVLLLTLYTDTNNPDKKSLIAFDVVQKQMLWWKNDFSLSVLSGQLVIGVDTKFGSKEVALNISDGAAVQKDFTVSYSEQNFPITRPFQYHEGSTHFDTVRAFLQTRAQISPIITIEYCEYHGLILISAFVTAEDLANYLFVFNSDGQILIKETLGEHLKGIALDTFFVFSGFLIFVKNKRELVSYRIL